MSLLEKSSLYDRHSHGNLGPSVQGGGEGPNPQDGAYFVDNESNPSSPFKAKSGGGGGLGNFDHMKALLDTQIFSENTGVTYHPSPLLEGGLQELHPGATDVWSGQPTNPNTGQFGGPYIASAICTSGGGFC